MTNTLLASFCFPLYQKLQLLKFNDIVKLQLAKIMHFVHNNNISNLYFGFSKVGKFHPEVESSRTSLASRTSSRTHFEVLGLEALGPRKLPCPQLEDSTIFESLKFCWKRQKPRRKFVNTFFVLRN